MACLFEGFSLTRTLERLQVEWAETEDAQVALLSLDPCAREVMLGADGERGGGGRRARVQIWRAAPSALTSWARRPSASSRTRSPRRSRAGWVGRRGQRSSSQC